MPKRILGIDPGSRRTGFGLLVADKSHVQCDNAGVISLTEKDFMQRLATLHENMTHLIQKLQPDEVAIEQVFVNKNVSSALKLGQARGVIIASAASAGCKLFEYTPREVKLAVVGRGGAEKAQVAHMMRALLRLNSAPPEDAADALAIALCHHNRQDIQKR